MTGNRRSWTWAAPLFALALGACHTTPRGSQNAYEASEGAHQMKAIEGNQLLARRLEITNPISRRQGDGRLQIQFDLRSKTSDPLRFAWAIDWYDPSGFRISDVTRRWEPVSLGGYGSTSLSAVAPTPAAASWKLQVTSPDEVQ
jgi:uncharacterized protein YcfL